MAPTTPPQVQSSLGGDPPEENKLGGLQHPSCSEKGNAAQRTRILAEGVQGEGRRGQAVKAGAQKREFGGRGMVLDVPAAQVSREGQRSLLTGHHAMSLPARK